MLCEQSMLRMNTMIHMGVFACIRHFSLRIRKDSGLFQTPRTNVVEHIKHIYKEGELEEESTCRKFRQVRKEGNREVSRELPFYNLDMIISLGYRIKSITATNFRRWATERLKENMQQVLTIIQRVQNLLHFSRWFKINYITRHMDIQLQK